MATIELAPVWQAQTHQAVFRRILDATARPGTISDLSLLLSGVDAWLGTLATFCDQSQTLADMTGRLGDGARRFLRTLPAAPDAARFVLADGAVHPGALAPCLGTLDAPDQGAMLVLCVERLGQGMPLSLSGPGIAGTRAFSVAGLDPGWLEARARWCAHFPLGCDFVLADRSRIAVLPRTTKILKGETWPT